MFNAQELKAELTRQDKNVDWLAHEIGFNQSQSLYNRLNGKTEFTITDANNIVKALNLSDEKIRNIFFNDLVEKTQQ